MQYKLKFLFVIWFLCFMFFAPLAHAFDIGGFLNIAGKVGGVVSGFSSVPGLSGGGSGGKVPILDEATVAIQQKEVGIKKIGIPGVGSLALPTGVSVSWDKLAWGLANMAIHKITKDIVSWIKTGGRDGKPLFITNWEDFLKGVANDASGIFIDELGITEICQPFKPRLQLLLSAGGGTYRQRAQCTITDVAKNVENFYRDFKQGGWERWFEITLVPQNNFYGAYYMSLEEKLLRESLAVEAKKSEALAGGGFLGEEVCVEFNNKQECVDFQILTPGKTIERQLNDVLAPPSGEKRLEVADEIDEIIAAALQRLTTSIRGKTNSSGKKQGIISSEPFNQFLEETKSDVSEAKQQVSNSIELPQAIALAQQITTTKQDSISKINSLIGLFESINSCQNTNPENDQRIKNSNENKNQLNTDIENINSISAQLQSGEQELAQAEDVLTIYQLNSELKSAIDSVISLYNSAIAENNQIAGEIETTQNELDQCLETQNEQNI